MAGLDDYKITNDDFSNKDIIGLPDKPSEAGMSAEDLKKRFDASSKHVVMPRFNTFVDLLAQKVAKSINITNQDGKGMYSVSVTMYDDSVLTFDLSLIHQMIQDNADAIQSLDESKAPAYSYGTTDLVEGETPLETGKLYFVYE